MIKEKFALLWKVLRDIFVMIRKKKKALDYERLFQKHNSIRI